MIRILIQCTKIPNSSSLRGFGLFFILVFIFSNCQQGVLLTTNDDIERAKAWFEKNEALLMNGGSSKGRGDSSAFFEKHPDWTFNS